MDMKENGKKEMLRQKAFIRRVVIISGIVIATIITAQNVGYSQDKKMTMKEKEDAWRSERLKKRAKEERLEFVNDSVQYAQAIVAIRNGSWALEASSIAFNNGNTDFVTPSTNYVSINNGIGTIQTALDNTNIYSPNGLGGVTLQGNVSNGQLTVDNQGNIYYNYILQGNNVSATVNIMIAANSNQATAYISPNFGSGNITMNGSIYPYKQAGVIQGTSDY
ncbi:MAG: DUF4251 domain-containing protein [Bacteroidaceae bacterium]|nr:DUF4251 domain-containing protein [Bacteroidaceae bacterium]